MKTLIIVLTISLTGCTHCVRYNTTQNPVTGWVDRTCVEEKTDWSWLLAPLVIAAGANEINQAVTNNPNYQAGLTGVNK